MNKVEFMRQLESLLQNISEQERQEALQYYGDYFDDAGPENEQAVLEALGNPARVAENIRKDLYGAGYGDGYEVRRPVTGRELTEYGAFAEESQNQGNTGDNTEAQNTAAQGAMSQRATTQGAAAQGATTQSVTAQDAINQSAMSQGATAQGAMSQGATTQDAMTQGATAQDAMTQGATAQDAMTQGATAQGAMSQGATAQDAMTQGATAQGAMSQGTAAQGAMSQGACPAPAAMAASPWQSSPQPAPAWGNAGQGAQGQSGKAGREPMSGWVIALIVILCIIGVPVGAGLLGGAMGIAGGILGGLLGLTVGWFAMILVFGIAALVCILAGVFVCVVGVAGMGLRPLAGLGLVGCGLIVVSIGIFFLMATVAMAGVITPAIFRGIRWLFTRKKKAA